MALRLKALVFLAARARVRGAGRRMLIRLGALT
jgi:hypothetical protein